MLGKLTVSAIAATAAALAIGGTMFLMNGHDAAAQTPGGQGAYFWSYATKFVCGLQAPNPAGTTGEPPVKPGNYATDINIHNPNYRDNQVLKKIVLLVGTEPQSGQTFARREPEVAAPGKFVVLNLPPDFATMDDCIALSKLANQTGVAGAGGFMIGYLVVLSRLDIDVDAVYTAGVYSTPNAANVSEPEGISEDVLKITGKRVLVPATVLPAGIQPAGD
jgi:hypothetical protein